MYRWRFEDWKGTVRTRWTSEGSKVNYRGGKKVHESFGFLESQGVYRKRVWNLVRESFKTTETEVLFNFTPVKSDKGDGEGQDSVAVGRGPNDGTRGLTRGPMGTGNVSRTVSSTHTENFGFTPKFWVNPT